MRKDISFYMESEMKKYMTPEAKNFFLCTWYRYMFPYIPYRTGLMASLMSYSEETANETMLSADESMLLGLESIKNDPENVIRFRAPYAARQYEGAHFNFTRDMHPLAQAYWGQVAADLHGEQIINEYIAFIKRSENK